jgi:3-oxoacyl-ACP reductase-like protein
MAEKKATTKKAAEVKETKVAAKKSTTAKKCAPKATAAKATVAVNAENIGFKAGDVYQVLAAAEKALAVNEIAKAAKISEEETLLGLGWLFKEGKLLSTEDNKVVLA